ncbi:uncharacterized protein DNG_03708 [Cephalotrichum gorgonifer]|uniref:DUF3074 domain-containing protein n=1 Tax=Cephalotrichum gorgonifer TaxID=2041049 RepID=A0AAE8SUI5_9PEZI|nr:uncharacterized protein DNG_03708 [Cephalotrichum gorgonifer]
MENEREQRIKNLEERAKENPTQRRNIEAIISYYREGGKWPQTGHDIVYAFDGSVKYATVEQFAEDFEGQDPVLNTLILLHEALAFLQGLAPKTAVTDEATTRVTSEDWRKSHRVKTLHTCDAPVHLNERKVPVELLRAVAQQNPSSPAPAQAGDSLRAEHWAARLSVHANAAESGTATWDEFYDAIKVRHAETEHEFTPSIVGMRITKEWDCEDVEVTEDDVKWGEFTLKIVESKHKLPAILGNRAFAVVQMTAAMVGSPDAQYCNEDGVVIGSYAAVERVRRVKSGATEWVMATASDAGGVLPSWLQAMAVPGQIAKDVPLFLVWADNQRKKRGAEGVRR